MTGSVLNRLLLHRFRSLSSEEVVFGNPMFLAGRNGSGKSNFVDAFAFLAEAMATPLQAVLDHRGGFSTVSNRASARGRPSNLGLGVVLKAPDPATSEARYAFELRAVKGPGFEVVREQCIVDATDGSSHWFDRRTSRGETRWRSNAGSMEPGVAASALALPLIGGDLRFRPVLEFVANMRIYRIEPAALRAMQDPDGGTRLNADGANTASVLRAIQRESPDDWIRILELLATIVPGVVDVHPRRHGNKLMLQFTQDWQQEEPVKFDAFSMSDGTLRVLGLLTAVYQRPAPSLLVIEEPEATMHPGALGAILDVVRHAGRTTQVVVTTHSPDVLDADWIRDGHLRIACWDRGTTRISRISCAARNALAEHLMGAGELLRSNALTPVDLFTDDPRQYDLFQDRELP